LLYQAFDGDLALVIVLGEISHHNTAKFFSPHDLTNQAIQDLQKNPALRNEMAGCNTFSMSAATGIPRETVRRKVAELERRGWIENVPKKGLRITPACSDHFAPDFSIKILSELLKAARTIEHVLSAVKSRKVRPSMNLRRKNLRTAQSSAHSGQIKPRTKRGNTNHEQ
jgi:DNA-binding transcriptional MocR family regulator